MCGGFGFDPLGLYNFFGPGDEGKRKMETSELKNGRLAMMAITGMAIQEALYKKPVVEQTPFFFKPFLAANEPAAATASSAAAPASAVVVPGDVASGVVEGAAAAVAEPLKDALSDALPAIGEAAAAAASALPDLAGM